MNGDRILLDSLRDVANKGDDGYSVEIVFRRAAFSVLAGRPRKLIARLSKTQAASAPMNAGSFELAFPRLVEGALKHILSDESGRHDSPIVEEVLMDKTGAVRPNRKVS